MPPVELKEITSFDADELISALQTDINAGLTDEEADRRIKEYGLNTIAPLKRFSWLQELLKHFKSPLVILLLIATIISFSVGESVNAYIIFAIVITSVIIDFIQERDARNAAEQLKLTVKSKASVIRNGIEQEILPRYLCPGDIILLNAGKVVPADARVVFAKDFFINQSSLTGESLPSEKLPGPIPLSGKTDLTAMQNITFMGTGVISGTAKAVVIQTGSRTEFGKIAEKLKTGKEESDFSRGMRRFGYLIMKVTIFLVLFIFLINSVMKQNVLESFIFSIAIAVGLTPELLPMIMSITMAKGSLQMAKKGVIVKNLLSIPNFGSMEILCTDKTGTLTEDKIILIKCVDVNGRESEAIFHLAYLNSFFQTGIKNPLDDAILDRKKIDISSYQKLDEIPFDFFRKRMSVVVQKENQSTLICKGAPDEILRACVQEKEFISSAIKEYEELSADGFRVLAIATKNVSGQQKFSKQDETQLYFEGFVAFFDPPKEDADEVIRELSAIGVEVKIITGDNHIVTQKICHELHLEIKGIMGGDEIDMLTDDALRNKVPGITIFTRFSPSQKNRIIEALKGNNFAVGYMGDGINDAPSLKAADIGISFNNATDVAKESADIILTKKDLMVLKEGILEGRKTFGNTMKYILMGLSSNFGNMFSVAAATLFLPFLPMLPVQILINNFLYDTSQVAIPTDNVDNNYVSRPHRWNLKMIYQYMIIFGITSSVFDLITFWILYKYFAVNEAQFRTGWFMESLATQILVIFIIRTQYSPFVASKPSLKLFLSAMICLFIGWLLPYLPFAHRIGFQVLSFHVIGYIISLTITYLICAEMVKRFIYNKLQKNRIF